MSIRKLVFCVRGNTSVRLLSLLASPPLAEVLSEARHLEKGARGQLPKHPGEQEEGTPPPYPYLSPGF